jgi:hypothetical protein
MTELKRRMMGELVFLNGKDEALAAGAKLVNAGFWFFLSNEADEAVNENAEPLPTAFAMVWRDYHADALKAAGSEHALAEQFSALVRNIIDQDIDVMGLVASDHIPTSFGDFGARGSELHD